MSIIYNSGRMFIDRWTEISLAVYVHTFSFTNMYDSNLQTNISTNIYHICVYLYICLYYSRTKQLQAHGTKYSWISLYAKDTHHRQQQTLSLSRSSGRVKIVFGFMRKQPHKGNRQQAQNNWVCTGRKPQNLLYGKNSRGEIAWNIKNEYLAQLTSS